MEDYAAQPQEAQPERRGTAEAEGEEPEEEAEDVSQVTEAAEVSDGGRGRLGGGAAGARAPALTGVLSLQTEAEPDTKEESDEDEEDDEESGRLRFKTERKDSTVVRLSDATSKRRNIPETLGTSSNAVGVGGGVGFNGPSEPVSFYRVFLSLSELTEEAKADLLEFEERERLRRQGRYGGRGRGGGGGGGVMGGRGRGGGGGAPAAFGMGGFRKDGGAGRGRTNEPRPPLMPVHLGMQVNTCGGIRPRARPPFQVHGLRRVCFRKFN